MFLTEKGVRILNPEPERIEFAKNISFYAVIGNIFDEDDISYLNTIESLFSSKEHTTVLLNAYKRSYGKEKWIQDYLSSQEIPLGNYHLCLIICNKNGPQQYMLNWKDIIVYFTDTIRDYGLSVDVMVPYRYKAERKEKDDPICTDIKICIPKHGNLVTRKSLDTRLKEQLSQDSNEFCEPVIENSSFGINGKQFFDAFVQAWQE